MKGDLLLERIWELLKKASELKGNSPLYCYPYIKEIVEEARKEFCEIIDCNPMDWIYHTGKKKQEIEGTIKKWFGSLAVAEGYKSAEKTAK